MAQGQISFSIDDQTRERLAKMAEDEDRTVSNMVAMLVKRAIEDREAARARYGTGGTTNA